MGVPVPPLFKSKGKTPSHLVVKGLLSCILYLERLYIITRLEACDVKSQLQPVSRVTNHFVKGKYPTPFVVKGKLSCILYSERL